jgi:hypothetical protein
MLRFKPLAYLLPVAGALAAGPAFAAAGDVHHITGEVVNLRAGPTDDANVRGTLHRGDEVIELRREGKWVGVRSTGTGAEGWVYSGLMRMDRPSGISGSTAAPAPPLFRSYSENFDALISDLSNRFGYPIFDKVEQVGTDTLRLVPSPAFLANGSREAHLLAALAVQQMWKNYHNGQPVGVMLTGEGGRDYVSLGDRGPAGPAISITPARQVAR